MMPSPAAPGSRILTYHVVRERPGRQALVGIRMVTDRWRLRAVPGLQVAKVLGTGRGADTGPSIDLRRQVYLLVWDGPESAARFVSSGPFAARWRRCEVQAEGALALVTGRGSWSGRPFLEGMRTVEPGGGPVVVVTRARVRASAWRVFRQASRATRSVSAAPGLEWVIGIGEFPVGSVGTLSRWESTEAADRYAAGDERHVRAADQGPTWFAESLFARFAPVDLDEFREPVGPSSIR